MIISCLNFMPLEQYNYYLFTENIRRITINNYYLATDTYKEGFVLGYNIIDIMDKAIAIGYKRKELYIGISNQNHQPPAVKILSKVLADNLDKTLLYYEKLKKEVNDKEVEKIDFGIYDKISFLINQFNLRIYTTDITTPKEFISFSLNFEKEILALFLDIQGRLIKNTNDTTSTAYMILTDMIKNKIKLIENLESHN